MELETFKKIIAEVLNVDTKEIMENMTFTGDLGADSLDIYQIVLKTEDAFSIRLDPEKVEKLTTVGEAYRLISQTKESAGKSLD